MYPAEAEQTTIDLREYIKIVKRRKWLILGTLFLIVAATALVSWRMTPIYKGVAQVEVQPVSTTGSEATQILESLIEPRTRLQTQVELIKSPAVLDRAAEALKLPSIGELKSTLNVQLLRDTQIVEISIEHPRPEEASAWANAVAQAYIDYRRDRAIEQAVTAQEEIARRVNEVRAQITEKDAVLADLQGAATELSAQRDLITAQLQTLEARYRAEQQGSTNTSAGRGTLSQMERLRVQVGDLNRQIRDYETGGSGPQSEKSTLNTRLQALEAQSLALPDTEAINKGGGAIVAPAETPGTPIRPKKVLNLLLAFVLGTLLGIALGFLAEALDDRVRSPEEVEKLIGAPILGYVPFVDDWDRLPQPFVAVIDDPSSGAAEAYRTLRTNLRFLALETDIKSILVTSALAGEGKTTTSVNLAIAFAEGSTKTILASCDLRKPSAYKVLGLSNDAGVVQALDPDYPLEKALQSNGVENFRFLAAGGNPSGPTEIVSSPRFAYMLKSLESSTDVVILDSPPLLGIADSGVIAGRVDGVLLVVDAHEVTRRSLGHAADLIRKAGGRILGAIMNAVEPQEGYGYYYQYYYYQYASDGERELKGKKRIEVKEVAE